MYKYYVQIIIAFFIIKISVAQDCTDLILSKADQYYTNVNSKPDSLSFLTCSFISGKLRKGELFIDFVETTVNNAPVFLVVVIAKGAEDVIIEIPKLHSFKDSEELSTASEEKIKRGVILPDKIRNDAEDYYRYDALMGYLEPYLANVKTIYYSTSDVLNFVNFKFLKTKKGKYLFEDFQVIRLHTAASFLGNREKLILPAQLNVLLVGNLVYNCPETNRGNQDQPDRNIWQYLTGTKKEVENIRGLLKYQNKLTLLDSCSATETKIVSMIDHSHYDIIHFATHGFYFNDTSSLFGLKHDSYSLLRSGIVLSGANHPDATTAPFNDKGMFTSLDFINMDISNVKLIVLSTCHSGEGNTSQSGAPLGLILALLRNGMNAMIVSNREVPDAETTIFMTAFYRYLNSNKDVDVCFRNTLKELKVCYPKTDWSFFDLVH